MRGSGLTRRIAAASMAVVLATSQAGAVNTAEQMFSDLGASSLQNNVTGFQEYRGANGEMVYGFGGSLVLKRPTPVYPQLYNLQAPEISASCSGISFKGMFGTIANLDELQRQFSEAGESLAYGILVGIIYSLPGVAEVFAKLDSWAKKIQQMLANSCRTGIAIGKVAGNEVFSQAGEGISGMIGQDTKAWVKKTGQNFGGIVDDIDRVLDCSATVSEWIGSGSCADLKSDTENTLAESTLAIPSLVAASAFNYREQNANTMPFETQSKAFKENDPTSAMRIRTGMQGYYRDLALVSLMRGVTGDVTLTYSDYIALKNGMEEVYKDSTGGSPATPQQRIKKLKRLAKEVVSIKEYACEDKGVNEEFAGTIIDFLINGNGVVATAVTPDANSSDVNVTGSSVGETIATKASLPQISVFEAPSSATREGLVFVIPYGPTKSGPFVSGIQNVLTGYAGIRQTAVMAKDCYLHDDATACGSVTYSLFDLDTQRFMAKVFRNTRDIGERHALESKFIDYAIYHMAYALTERINDVVRAYSNRADRVSARIDPNDEATAKETSFAECIALVEYNAKKFASLLNEKVGEFLEKAFAGHEPNVAGIYQIFVEQNRVNMKRALERLNRK